MISVIALSTDINRCRPIEDGYSIKYGTHIIPTDTFKEIKYMLKQARGCT